MTRLPAVFGRFTALLFPLILSLILAGCSSKADSGAGKANGQLVPAVEAVQAKFGSLPLTERLSGLVKGKNQVELYPQLSAAIVEVYVGNGSLVNSGDPLVRLRDTEFREQLKQAEASLQIARAQAKQAEAEWSRMQSELKRNTSLSEKNLISPTDFEKVQSDAAAAEASADLAHARVQQAQATVDERKEELSRTIVRAPVDGTVGNRNAEVGMVVTPSTRLFVLGQLDSVRVEVVLSDHMLSYIKEDQRSEILSPTLPDGSITAPVARVSPFLHPVTHSTIAEIDVANPKGNLKPGMFVTVDIFYGESDQATLVPLSALWENPGKGTVGVYVSRDSLTGELIAVRDDSQGGKLTPPMSFQFLPVDVIAKGRMSAGVRGLDPGDWIVTLGQDMFSADTGQARVRPVKWKWVEELQHLQREDLLDEIMSRPRENATDTGLIGTQPAEGKAGA